MNQASSSTAGEEFRRRFTLCVEDRRVQPGYMWPAICGMAVIVGFDRRTWSTSGDIAARMRKPELAISLGPAGIGLREACRSGRHKLGGCIYPDHRNWIHERGRRLFWHVENDGPAVCRRGLGPHDVEIVCIDHDRRVMLADGSWRTTQIGRAH